MSSKHTESAETWEQTFLQRLQHPERHWLGMSDASVAFRLSGYGEVLEELCQVRALDKPSSTWKQLLHDVLDDLGVPPGHLLDRSHQVFQDPNILKELQALKEQRQQRKRTDRRNRRRARQVGATLAPVNRGLIIARDKSTCHLCGKVCNPGEIHLDHVIPLSKGGTHSEDNLRVACASCNIRKSDTMPSAASC